MITGDFDFLSRLKKEAVGLGNSDVKESDLRFEQSGSQIKVYLENEDVRKHEEDNWDDSIYYDGEDEAIAFIEWDIRNSKVGSEKVEIIYVNYLEARPEYNQTKVAWYLMEKFFNDVVKPEVDKLGAENVYMDATFANLKLGETVKRYVKKKLDVQWADALEDRLDDWREENDDEDDGYYSDYDPSDDYDLDDDLDDLNDDDFDLDDYELDEDEHYKSFVISFFEQNNIKYEDMGEEAKIIDKNSIKTLAEKGSGYGLGTFDGFIERNGNIAAMIALSNDLLSGESLTDATMFFYYPNQSPNIKLLELSDLSILDNFGGKAAIQNLIDIFGGDKTIGFSSNSVGVKTLNETLESYNNQATANKNTRLKRRG